MNNSKRDTKCPANIKEYIINQRKIKSLIKSNLKNGRTHRFTPTNDGFTFVGTDLCVCPNKDFIGIYVLI